MNAQEAVKRALKEDTLAKALSSVALYDCERAIQQARRFFETGERTGADGAGWDTCFEHLFTQVLEQWEASVATQSGMVTISVNGVKCTRLRGSTYSYDYLVSWAGMEGEPTITVKVPGKGASSFTLLQETKVSLIDGMVINVQHTGVA